MVEAYGSTQTVLCLCRSSVDFRARTRTKADKGGKGKGNDKDTTIRKCNGKKVNSKGKGKKVTDGGPTGIRLKSNCKLSRGNRWHVCYAFTSVPKLSITTSFLTPSERRPPHWHLLDIIDSQVHLVIVDSRSCRIRRLTFSTVIMVK